MSRTLIAAIVAGAALIAVGVANSRPPSKKRTRGAGSGSFVIRDVRVFDGERTIPRTDVVVRDGVIASVGGAVPEGLESVDGANRTLLPGFIDAHTHAFGNALERALVFGVTTELDMFTEHGFAAAMRKEQRQLNGAARRADLFSAGTLVTAPGGHGTEYGIKIPTLTSPADAGAFVKARIAEGSDYIKIVYDDGVSYGLSLPTVDLATLAATLEAAEAAGKLGLVHIGSRRAAEDAISAGADGLIHIFADAPADEAFVRRVVASGAFVTPTLSVTESTTGVPSGAKLADDERLKPLLTPGEQKALGAAFPARATSRQKLEHALTATRLLHQAGVPILAGTDAPNPGTAHGVSMHRELELLVRAGLAPEAALAAATGVPARVFRLGDRGRIAPGMRADLVLIEGDPTRDITASRTIAGIWKGGIPADRPSGKKAAAAPAASTATGLVSTFDDEHMGAEFGTGWQVSTDAMMGGKSEAALRLVAGANGTRGALEVTGAIAAGAPYPWAGAMFFPADTPMTPVDLSRFKEIVFWARGDGGEHQLMVFDEAMGQIPATFVFKTGPEWREFVVPFSRLSGIDGSGIRGVLFSAAGPGPFRFAVDEVRFRR